MKGLVLSFPPPNFHRNFLKNEKKYCDDECFLNKNFTLEYHHLVDV